MATKAEWFRYETERSGRKRAKAAERTRGRGDGTGEQSPHNVSARAAKNASYAFEAVASGRPSRKSSRKAANRQKNDVQFRMKRATDEVRPEVRAALNPGRA